MSAPVVFAVLHLLFNTILWKLIINVLLCAVSPDWRVHALHRHACVHTHTESQTVLLIEMLLRCLVLCWSFVFIRTLTSDREKQSSDMVSIERTLATLRIQLDSLQTTYEALAARSKACCINDTALVAAIRGNVNEILAEVCSFGYNGSVDLELRNGGWGNPLHLFCSCFITQLYFLLLKC